jgi:hypothetical protein
LKIRQARPRRDRLAPGSSLKVWVFLRQLNEGAGFFKQLIEGTVFFNKPSLEMSETRTYLPEDILQGTELTPG